MSGKKTEKRDETPVEFVASMSDDRKIFSLVITCEDTLSDEEYAASLISFAEDILNGDFNFDDEANETLAQ